MGPWLSERGVEVIALSKDTPAQVRLHRTRDDLEHVRLLSDPKLEVIEALGALHQKAGEMKTFEVLGLPLGYPVGFKDMAVPTTFLIDGEGVVRWIDQAEDYRLRGDEARIQSAVEAIGWSAGAPGRQLDDHIDGA